MAGAQGGESWESFLREGEVLLWTGAPSSALRVRRADRIAVPISVAIAVFAGAWNAVAWNEDAPTIFPAVGAAFLLFALYVLIGRFYHDAWRRRRTRYAITSERLLIATNSFSRAMKALELDGALKVERRRGDGDFVFGAPYSVSGAGGAHVFAGAPAEFAIEAVEDGEAVQAALERAMARATDLS